MDTGRNRAISAQKCFFEVDSHVKEDTALSRPKLIRITTVAGSLNGMLSGQLAFLSRHFELVGAASGAEILKEISKREKIRTIDIPMRREISIAQDVKSLCALIRLFRRERPFIVHANTPKASLLAMCAAWLTHTPHRIYTVTGLRFETAQGSFRFLLKTMERLTCFFATKVIPEGDGVKNTLLQERITRKPMQKILNGNINGVDLDFFQRNKEIENLAVEIRQKISDGKNTDNMFVFGFAGRIVKDKGINELVRAFVKLKNSLAGTLNVKLLLLGDFEDSLDPIAKDVRNEIFQKNSEIYALGYKDDLRPYYAAMDAFVLPSYREGFPNSVLQAGAMSVPAIVSDISGCNEIVINGKNGLIIPKGNEEALLSAMKQFCDKRSTNLPAMAACSRELIASRYDRNKVWQAILEMYSELGKHHKQHT